MLQEDLPPGGRRGPAQGAGAPIPFLSTPPRPNLSPPKPHTRWLPQGSPVIQTPHPRPLGQLRISKAERGPGRPRGQSKNCWNTTDSRTQGGGIKSTGGNKRETSPRETVFTTATSGDSTSLADLRRLSLAAAPPEPGRPLSSRLRQPAAPGYALGERRAPIGRSGPAKLRGFAGRRSAHALLLGSGALATARGPAPGAGLPHFYPRLRILRPTFQCGGLSVRFPGHRPRIPREPTEKTLVIRTFAVADASHPPPPPVQILNIFTS
ncbi:uncharacterized protein [Physeter macrocephalus]|uniref:Uncharacterized protein n=1 Tax=Physeter macrocephalus TaxID=9755 RepID=A0A455BZV2_PHYMC|nr:uncharacterized protein LOC114486823 [Physeter catodon]|eukprot:XP_028349276.1 uncharacterized protein LOC114486823 [Physeter catodon]